MTRLLEEAFNRAAQLPEQEQNAFAALMLEELRSDERWTRYFAESQDMLARLAAEALHKYHVGPRSRPD